MRTAGALLLLALLARAEEGLGVRVNRALDAAAENLVARQAEDGSWQKEDAVHPIGRTALCCYAVLHAGYPRDHPAVEKAVRFLDGREPRSTYEAGCLLLLLHALGPEHDERIRRVCAWLVERFDDGAKLWGYPDGSPDLSNTQFAVFGLKVGEMHGFEVPADLWRSLLRSVPRLQQRDGAFRYRAGELYRASMTHAALIVLRFASQATSRRPPAEIRHAIARGQAWFEEHYDVEKTPWGRGHHHGHYYYYMYGLSRYAQILGLDRIKGRDWYAEGAEALLARQKTDGSWGSLEDTSFAILFLRKVVFTRPEVRAKGKGGGNPAEEAKRPKPADDVPFLRSWLVAGPFRGEPGEDDRLFAEDFRVADAAPAQGRAAGKAKWESYESPENRLDFKKACGASDWSGYWAACYLHAEGPRSAILWIGSDDGCRAWLDGKEVLFGHHHDYSGDDFYRVPVELGGGRHLLLVHVETHGYDALLKVRVSDAEGRPLAGVSASARRRP